MAGKRQHILPRFLLRGFASRVVGEKTFTWVYRISGEQFETTIENVGLEKHFYGKEGEVSADDVITNLEGNYADLVRSLRNTSDGIEVQDTRIPELISHLTIRTKHLREFFLSSTEYLLGEVTTHLAEPRNLKRLLLSKPELIQEELGKRLTDYQIPEEQRTFLVELVKAYAPTLVDQHMSEFQETLMEMVGNIGDMLPRAVREGHIKSLAKNPAPENRSQTYDKLRWFVRESSIPLILGDFACLFEIARKRRFKSLDDMGDPIVNVYLPISGQKVLVGTSYSSASHVDFSLINDATANCSYEYFVAPECSAANDKRASKLGAWAGLLTQAELDALFHEIIEDVERDPFGR